MHLFGYNHLIPNKCEWNNCFIKNHQEILLDLVDFALQEQPEDKLMVAISRPWYNGSYTMAARPIKMLELHYTMIQFLIIIIMLKVVTYLLHCNLQHLINTVYYIKNYIWVDMNQKLQRNHRCATFAQHSFNLC